MCRPIRPEIIDRIRISIDYRIKNSNYSVLKKDFRRKKPSFEINQSLMNRISHRNKPNYIHFVPFQNYDEYIEHKKNMKKYFDNKIIMNLSPFDKLS